MRRRLGPDPEPRGRLGGLRPADREPVLRQLHRGSGSQVRIILPIVAMSWFYWKIASKAITYANAIISSIDAIIDCVAP